MKRTALIYFGAGGEVLQAHTVFTVNRMDAIRAAHSGGPANAHCARLVEAPHDVTADAFTIDLLKLRQSA